VVFVVKEQLMVVQSDNRRKSRICTLRY